MEERKPQDHAEDKTAAELNESAFRRGFQHGAEYVLRMLRAGYDLEDFDNYGWSDAVHDWRFRLEEFELARHEFQFPPGLRWKTNREIA